ncbi:peptidase inhibitor family I36 protein [Streptomyces sp. NPDC056169]|uniref:peptidase inhibitor family I36 protein n=1 Tax=Streptomyces sp. NPDC056169 TaxID=3345734 RepID=UPI0035DB3354
MNQSHNPPQETQHAPWTHPRPGCHRLLRLDAKRGNRNRGTGALHLARGRICHAGQGDPAAGAVSQDKPVIATYKGKKIDLANGWQGAQACSETPSGEVFCYDTAEEADRALAAIAPTVAKGGRSAGASAKESGQLGPTASGDCSYGWVCPWENSDYTGRRLQWSAKGTKQLADWSFRDQASAGCVKRDMGGALVYDARTGMTDPYMSMGNLACYNFTKADYWTGGTWNDKADYIEM